MYSLLLAAASSLPPPRLSATAKRAATAASPGWSVTPAIEQDPAGTDTRRQQELLTVLPAE